MARISSYEEDYEDYDNKPQGESTKRSERCEPDYEMMIKHQHDRRDKRTSAREALQKAYLEEELPTLVSNRVLHCIGILYSKELGHTKAIAGLIAEQEKGDRI